MFERYCFVFQLTAFKAEQSVWQRILLFGRNVFLDNLYQIRQRHDCTPDNEIEHSLLFFGTGMTESDIFQSDGIRHFSGYAHFLTDTVDQMKLGFRK